MSPCWKRSPRRELTAGLSGASALRLRVYLGLTLSGGFDSTTSIVVYLWYHTDGSPAMEEEVAHQQEVMVESNKKSAARRTGWKPSGDEQ